MSETPSSARPHAPARAPPMPAVRPTCPDRFKNPALVVGAVTEERLVEPGTPLAYSEELLPGSGTYDDGHQIRAALFGREHVDPETMQVTVRPAGKPVAQVEKGDVIVGEVTFTKPELASVRILEIRGKEGRSVLHQVEGTLHVSKVDKRYIKSIEDEFRPGDIIRAKVIGMKGGPQLVTDAPDLGCIAAFSPEDPRRRLVPHGDHLIDPEAGKHFRRKLADDYGSGLL